MRALSRYGQRAFTLVELMVVVAIIGVLSALALFGTRRYLAAAKTAEAKFTLGDVTRSAQGAFERESAASQLLGEGSLSVATAHSLCGNAQTTPAAVPAGTKYQPVTSSGNDFNSGDAGNGWKCLRFARTEPIYYRYSYLSGSGGGFVSTALGAPSGSGNLFEAAAQGDLDGNSILSTFARGGQVNPATNQLVLWTQVFINNEYE